MTQGLFPFYEDEEPAIWVIYIFGFTVQVEETPTGYRYTGNSPSKQFKPGAIMDPALARFLKPGNARAVIIIRKRFEKMKAEVSETC